MNTRCAVACVLALSCGLAVRLSGQTPTTFRARTDIVPVFVSVRAGESFIGGLRQRDFELDDNGVPQQIDSVSSDAVPIDVTLVVDTSSSVIGSLDQFKADVVTIAGMLRPDEQMRLVTFDTGVREILPMQPAPASPPIERIRLGDQTSLNDALLFSLARERRPDRRHLVFVFTDGFDTASVLDYGSLPEVASRADALLHIVTVRPALRRDNASTRPFGLMAEAAARTGGALYPPSREDDTIVKAFERAINAFRHSYVLYFTPREVPRPGWHTLTVRLLKPGSYEVRSRQGYFGN